MELLKIIHRDFEMFIECSKFDDIWEKAKRNVGEENLTSTYTWSEGVVSVALLTDAETRLIEYGESAPAIFFDNNSKVHQSPIKVEFLNADEPFEGWKTIMWNTTEEKTPAWISYDRVDFGSGDYNAAAIRVNSLAGGVIELRADAVDGPVIATIPVEGRKGWTEQVAVASEKIKGLHNLYVLMTSGSHIEIDWVSFK